MRRASILLAVYAASRMACAGRQVTEWNSRPPNLPRSRVSANVFETCVRIANIEFRGATVMRTDPMHVNYSLVAVAVAFILAAASAQAQESAKLEEIVVTAQKREQNVQDVGIS